MDEITGRVWYNSLCECPDLQFFFCLNMSKSVCEDLFYEKKGKGVSLSAALQLKITFSSRKIYGLAEIKKENRMKYKHAHRIQRPHRT